MKWVESGTEVLHMVTNSVGSNELKWLIEVWTADEVIERTAGHCQAPQKFLPIPKRYLQQFSSEPPLKCLPCHHWNVMFDPFLCHDQGYD